MKRTTISLPVAIAVTAAWTIIAVIGVLHHEIWLDEAQHWLLARDSKSIGEMFDNMRYEGHPPLWNLLLFGVSRISDSVITMQIVHLCFAAGSVLILLRCAPFPRWITALLPFTYFFGYEYAIISRNYAPAVFFILLAMVFISNQKNSGTVPILLAIATWFHIYALLVAFPLLVFWLWSLHKRQVSLKRPALWSGVFVLLAIVAAWIVNVPKDHFLFSLELGPTFTAERIGTIVLVPFTALMHLPALTGDHWWNSNVFLPTNDWIKAVIAVAFWILSALVFKKDKPVFLLYIVGACIMSVALFCTPMVISTRHAGFMAIFFFCCLWLSNRNVVPVFAKTIAGIIMAVQVCSFAVTYYKEIVHPFSQSKNVADFVSENYRGMKVIVNPHYVGPPIAAYLRKNIYYPEQERESSFTSWKMNTFAIDSVEFISRSRKYMRENNLDSVVVISCADNFDKPLTNSGREVAMFTGAAVRAENYKISILKK